MNAAATRDVVRVWRWDRDRAVVLLDQGVVSATRFFTTVALGRVCAPEELGVFSMGFSIVLIALAVLESLISRPYTILHSHIEDGSQAQYAAAVFMHGAALAAIAVTALILAQGLVSTGVGPARLGPVLWALAAAVPFVLLWEFGRRMAFAHLGFATALLMDLGMCVVQLGGLVLLAAGGWLSAPTAHAMVGFACGVAGVAWLAGAWKGLSIDWARVGTEWRRSWGFGKWIMGDQVAAAAQLGLMYWLLALVLDSGAAGLFAGCMAIVALSNPFVIGMGNILMPRTARAYARGGTEAVWHSVWSNTALMALVMSVFCGALYLFGARVLDLLFGGEFADGANIVPVLALGAMLWASSIPASIGFAAIGRPQVNFKLTLVTLIVLVLLAPPAMEQAGLVGAAWSWALTSGVGAVLAWLVFARLGRDPGAALGLGVDQVQALAPLIDRSGAPAGEERGAGCP